MRKPTIYEVLREKLGREPTHNELVAEVKRILADASIELAGKGKLPHQRKKNPMRPLRRSRAYINRPAERTRRAPTRRLKRRRSANRVKKFFPNPNSRYHPLKSGTRPRSGFVIGAKKGKGKKMFFTGEKFSDFGKPEFFSTQTGAVTKAKALIEQYPILKGYDVTVEGKVNKNPKS